MCAFKDELKKRSDNCDETTEMTAMTSQAETVALDEESDLETDVRGHRKAFYKRLLHSPAGRCKLLASVLSCAVLLAYILAKLVVGTLHINSCPVDTLVPIYLITSSALLLICIVVIIIVYIKCRREVHDERVSPHHLIALVYFFLHLVLQLAGSVCVIRTRQDVSSLQALQSEPTVEPSQDVLCDQGLLDFAFGVVIFELVISGLVLVGVVLVLGEVIYLVCCQPEPSKQSLQQANGVS